MEKWSHRNGSVPHGTWPSVRRCPKEASAPRAALPSQRCDETSDDVTDGSLTSIRSARQMLSPPLESTLAGIQARVHRRSPEQQDTVRVKNNLIFPTARIFSLPRKRAAVRLSAWSPQKSSTPISKSIFLERFRIFPQGLEETSLPLNVPMVSDKLNFTAP
jgi:hypothetical protein